MEAFALRLLTRILPFLLVMPATANAQQFQAPSRVEATAALSPAASRFTRQQLDQMLAPIALYPDQLLTMVLMAATFPQQVLDANQWLQDPNNAALKGDDLAAALQPLPWDPSVKSLVAFPQVIALMADHLDWTEALGVAFANQQIETMARAQSLRRQALAAGRLRSTPQLRIERDGPEVVIEPADPAVVYVPIYNPAEIYGQWAYPDYPPVYVPPPPGFIVGGIGAGIGFSIGFGIVRPLWGWGRPDWHRHEIVVDRSRYTNITSVTGITNNNVVIQNNAWHRTAPVAQVAIRPPPAPTPATHPPGTVTPAAVAIPRLAPAPSPRPRPPAPSTIHPPAPEPHPPVPVVTHPPPPAPQPPAPAVTRPPAPEPHPPVPVVTRPPAPEPRPPAPVVTRPPAPEPHPPAPVVTRPPAPEPHPPAPVVTRPPAPEPRPPAPVVTRPPAPAAHPPAPAVTQPPAPAPHPPTPASQPPSKQPPEKKPGEPAEPERGR